MNSIITTNKYNSKAKLLNYQEKLLFTDTNSLTYEIKTKCVNKDFSIDNDIMDINEYPCKNRAPRPHSSRWVLLNCELRTCTWVSLRWWILPSSWISQKFYLKYDSCNNITPSKVLIRLLIVWICKHTLKENTC